MNPLYYDEREGTYIDKCPVIFMLPEAVRCPNCDHEIRAILHYQTADVYEMSCKECGYERAHPGGTPGMYWNFVWDWEHKQGKHADWADHNR